ncbi:MAG: hypothetical protein IPI13_15765, partial [Actinomycetales bacterium]|nr:hypothetical protein [Candidatus Phosphoribacter hodrii]
KPAEEDSTLEASAKAYVQKQVADQKAGLKPVTNDGPVRRAEDASSKVPGPAATAGW